jgi:hypothetical protein
MEFKKGYKIKPKGVTIGGNVVFEDVDGNQVGANQKTCEAYGFTFDQQTGTCMAFTRKIRQEVSVKNKTNLISGIKNRLELTRNSFVNGVKNNVKGYNDSVLVTGQDHEVDYNINNSSIIGGQFAKSIRQSEVLIGGGGLNRSATDASDTNLSIQGDGSSYIVVQNNSLLAFECHVNALVTGGDDGTAGHYRYEKIVGTILIDNSGTRTYNQTTTTVKSNGTVGGTATTLTNIGDDVTLLVVGTANINVQWYASITLYENKLKTITF